MVKFTYALCSSSVSELRTLLLHNVLASFFIVLSGDSHLLKGALREERRRGRAGEGRGGGGEGRGGENEEGRGGEGREGGRIQLK